MARHRQASKRWRPKSRGNNIRKKESEMHYMAMDRITGEMCGHCHHTERSASSCGRAHWEDYQVVTVNAENEIIVENRTIKSKCPRQSYKPINKMSEVGQEYI